MVYVVSFISHRYSLHTDRLSTLNYPPSHTLRVPIVLPLPTLIPFSVWWNLIWLSKTVYFLCSLPLRVLPPHPWPILRTYFHYGIYNTLLPIFVCVLSLQSLYFLGVKSMSLLKLRHNIHMLMYTYHKCITQIVFTYAHPCNIYVTRATCRTFLSLQKPPACPFLVTPTTANIFC